MRDTEEQFAEDEGATETDSMEGPDLEDPLLGSVIDERFRIDAILGTGATGRVYRANQLSVGRDVAVKVLRGGFRTDPESRRRFFREAQAISGFNHPNIVRLIDFGEAEEHEYAYLVMELVEGVELSSLVDAGRIEPRAAATVVYQSAAALIEAHGADIVHRDMKTDNILLLPLSNGRMQVKVLDFGVAFPRDHDERLTKAGQVFGTPAYMAPEQGEGKDVGPPADIYALGVIFFELVTGTIPFRGETSLATMMRHVEAERPVPSEQISGSLPQGIDPLIRDMMARDPEDRPEDAHAVRDRIEGIRDHLEWDDVRVDAEDPLDEVFAPFVIPQSEDGEGETSEHEEFVAESTHVTGSPEDDAEVRARAPTEASEPADTGDSGPGAERRFAADDSESGRRATVRDGTTQNEVEGVPDGEVEYGATNFDLRRTALWALAILMSIAGVLIVSILYVRVTSEEEVEEPAVAEADRGSEGSSEATAGNVGTGRDAVGDRAGAGTEDAGVQSDGGGDAGRLAGGTDDEKRKEEGSREPSASAESSGAPAEGGRERGGADESAGSGRAGSGDESESSGTDPSGASASNEGAGAREPASSGSEETDPSAESSEGDEEEIRDKLIGDDWEGDESSGSSGSESGGEGGSGDDDIDESMDWVEGDE